MSKTEELLKLISENPELPVVPIVDGEVVGDGGDKYYWLGAWGRSEITEYYVGREHVHLKGDDEDFVLCDMQGCKHHCTPDGNDIFDLSNEEWKKLYDSVPWVECIVVYITT